MKKRLAIDIALDAATLDDLRQRADLDVVVLEPDQQRKELPSDLTRNVHVLMCKNPPANFDALSDLEWLQLTTAGYEHWKPVRPWEKPVRVSNARGVFDTAIAEWNLAMMINLTRDLRGMIRRQESKTWKR